MRLAALLFIDVVADGDLFVRGQVQARVEYYYNTSRISGLFSRNRTPSRSQKSTFYMKILSDVYPKCFLLKTNKIPMELWRFLKYSSVKRFTILPVISDFIVAALDERDSSNNCHNRLGIV